MDMVWDVKSDRRDDARSEWARATVTLTGEAPS